MKKKQIVGAVVAAVLFIVIGVSSVLTHAFSNMMFENSMEDTLTGGLTISLPLTPYIGIVDVSGVIQAQTETSVFDEVAGYQHITTLEYIDRLMEDENNKGLLLRVDSPGGTVYESEELYLKLVEYKEETKRPVWTYMEHYAASGGYMISSPSDKIYANSNTTTGSIGVIMSGYDMKGLYKKLGIKQISITSGKNKDMSQMTDEQVAIYQAQVDEYYERFVEIVADGRHMTEEEVKAIADGRTYTAKQALNNGLIDGIGLYEDVTNAMATEVGTTEFYEPDQAANVLAQLFGKISDVKPRSESEVLIDLTEQFGKGVPMYYAEQLQ